MGDSKDENHFAWWKLMKANLNETVFHKLK